MSRAQQGLDPADTTPEEPWVALDAAQAQSLRQRLLPWSPWGALRVQAWLGLVCVVLWGLATQSGATALSAAWGALAALLPAAVFARAMSRMNGAQQAATALLGFWVWEGVKLALTLGMLLATPFVLARPHWWAVLVTFGVTLKTYGVALWLQMHRTTKV